MTSALKTIFSKFLHRTFKYILGHQVPKVFEISACTGGTEGPEFHSMQQNQTAMYLGVGEPIVT